MKTAIYARQSVNKKDSISIETQIDICKREIKDNGPIEIYQDKGYSGKNTSRPAFQSLLNDVKQNKINNIIVYRLDRISRSVLDFANIIDILKEHNVGFVSANEKFDTTTPVGKAMLYIVMVFAQLERETIAERVKDNYYARGTEGVWLGGPAPYGFNNTKISIGNKNVATIVPNEKIELIKWIFEQYQQDDTSLGIIARQLVAQHPGEMWNNIKLSRILHNPAYVRADVDVYNYFKSKGCIIKSDISQFDGIHGLNIYGKRDRTLNKYNNIENHHVTVSLHEGIISSRDWLQCQYKLENNIQIKNTGTGKHTWLTGLLKCGYCGRAVTPKKTTKTTMKLYCSGKPLGLCDEVTNSHYLTDVENLVSEKIKKYIDKMQECEINTIENANETEINILKIELVKVETEIDCIVNNLTLANEVMMKYANEKIIELDKKRNEILGKLSKLSVAKPHKLDVPDICDWDSGSKEFKKEVANILIDRVLIYNDQITVKWKY